MRALRSPGGCRAAQRGLRDRAAGITSRVRRHLIPLHSGLHAKPFGRPRCAIARRVREGLRTTAKKHCERPPPAGSRTAGARSAPVDLY